MSTCRCTSAQTGESVLCWCSRGRALRMYPSSSTVRTSASAKIFGARPLRIMVLRKKYRRPSNCSLTKTIYAKIDLDSHQLTCLDDGLSIHIAYMNNPQWFQWRFNHSLEETLNREGSCFLFSRRRWCLALHVGGSSNLRRQNFEAVVHLASFPHVIRYHDDLASAFLGLV